MTNFNLKKWYLKNVHLEKIEYNNHRIQEQVFDCHFSSAFKRISFAHKITFDLIYLGFSLTCIEWKKKRQLNWDLFQCFIKKYFVNNILQRVKKRTSIFVHEVAV